MVKIRKCCSCKRTLPLTVEYFRQKPHASLWFKGECLECEKESNKEKLKFEKELEILRLECIKENLLRKESRKAYSALKRKKLKISKINLLTTEQWEQTKRYFHNRCAYCGRELNLIHEHVIPKRSNGEFTINNIVPACYPCNISKSSKVFSEWYPAYKYYSKERETFILDYLGYKPYGQQLRIFF